MSGRKKPLEAMSKYIQNNKGRTNGGNRSGFSFFGLRLGSVTDDYDIGKKAYGLIAWMTIFTAAAFYYKPQLSESDRRQEMMQRLPRLAARQIEQDKHVDRTK